MTAKEYRLKLIDMKAAYFGERERIAMVAALDTIGRIKRRVINTRKNAQGGIFGIYSPQYQKVRKEKGLPGDKINFSFTAEMWKNTTARVLSVTDAEIVILLSPSAEHIEKMIKNTERFGTILELNAKEEANHRKIYEDTLRDIV